MNESDRDAPIAAAYVPLAVVSRSGRDESVHSGAVVCLGPSGDVVYVAGDPHVAVYPRSSTKPLQAAAMVRRGLCLDPQLLALVCASHDGTPQHLAAARAILQVAGQDESALANTPGMPIDLESAAAVLRAGGGPTSLQQNCSGKHAGMLATCVINGWPTDPGYLSSDHPLQLAITAEVDELCATSHRHIGVDGCGAPAHVVPLIGLARAFATLARDRGEVYRAMTGHPEMVGGARREVTTLMRTVDGVMAKDGAEGVFACALPDGRAVALKIADGAGRACAPVMLAALQRLGVDTTAAAPAMEQVVLGHGRPVGHVRASLR